MITPKKMIDIEDHKKDKNRIKTEVDDTLKKEFKEYRAIKKIRIRIFSCTNKSENRR